MSAAAWFVLGWVCAGLFIFVPQWLYWRWQLTKKLLEDQHTPKASTNPIPQPEPIRRRP